MAGLLVIIPAAGAGTRFGGDLPKQFLPLAGKPILQHVIERFIVEGSAARIVVPVAESLLASIKQAGDKVQFVAGGATRQQSVLNGLAAAEGEFDLVAVHDAVRPFFRFETFRALLAAAREHGGSFPALPVTDTIHRIVDDSIAETLDRSELAAAQTPQCFRFDVLRDSLARAGEEGVEGTDEAGLAARYGHKIRVVLGDSYNIKITRPDDLALAESHFDEWSAA